MPESHVDEMLRWIEQHRDEIDRMRVGELLVHWGEDVSYKLARIERVKLNAVRRLAG